MRRVPHRPPARIATPAAVAALVAALWAGAAAAADTTDSHAAMPAAVPASPPAAGPAAPGADLKSLLDFARARHPELAAMQHEAEAAAQRITPAGALPDPMLRVELDNFTNTGNERRPNLLPAKVGETKYTVTQSLPLWGRRELRRDVAAADAEAARERARATWNELAARLKAAYAQYLFAVGTRSMALELVDVVSRLEQLAAARHAAGLAAQQDVIRAQLEQTAMRAELIGMESEIRQARVRINALLAREPGAPLADPQGLRAVPTLAAADAPLLVERARTTNPALATEEARLRGARSNRELVQTNRRPDIAVGLSSTQMGNRVAAWGLMVELNLPLQRESRSAQEAEADAMIAAQRARAEALQAQLLGELGEHLAALEAAREGLALLDRQLLPQAELALRSALAAYENGKVDFATLLDAQRQIHKAHLDQLKAQVEAQRRLAEIERIVGEDL